MTNEIMDYIENDLQDSIEACDIKQYSHEECLNTLQYVYKNGTRQELEDLKHYLAFTPYNDLLLKSIDYLVYKYPNSGYEINYAIYYSDKDPKKSIDICIDLLKKSISKKEMEKVMFYLYNFYKDNNDLIDKNFDLSIVDYKYIEKYPLYFRNKIIERGRGNE